MCWTRIARPLGRMLQKRFALDSMATITRGWILHVIKSRPNGLTEQAIDAARRMKFTPALIDGAPVSQVIQLDYHFNRY